MIHSLVEAQAQLIQITKTNEFSNDIVDEDTHSHTCTQTHMRSRKDSTIACHKSKNTEICC